MNAQLNKPLLSVMAVAVIIAAFVGGVGMAPMIASLKVSDNMLQQGATIPAIAMAPFDEEVDEEDFDVACDMDGMWQPAVWDTKRVQDTQLTVRF